MQFTIGEIMKGMFDEEDGKQIPDEFYCENCGCLLASDETAFQLEEHFSRIPRRGPVYVDICNCEDSLTGV